jgi:GH15 family glucan-1,4-alpha-glucosidase
LARPSQLPLGAALQSDVLGSVWPHDNALIALGLSRYGGKAAVARIFQALFDAATYMDLRRLPELFCGFTRVRGRGPTLCNKHVMRYTSEDDFGVLESAFFVCRFWLIDVWWKLGRREQALDMFTDALRYRNRYGLLAEHVHLKAGELWGNFPQTYSMAGMILTSMRLSRSWEDRYWHD